MDRALRRQGWDAASADDAIQHLDEAAYFAVERRREVRNELAWSARVVSSSLFQARRLRDRLKRSQSLADLPDVARSRPDRLATSREALCRIRAAIDALPDRLRLVAELRWIEGRSVAELAPEISAAYGVGVWQVRKLLEQSREMIQSELDGIPARSVWPSRYRKKEL